MTSGGNLWGDGYVMLPRALFRSSLWRSLSTAQRSVAVTLWVLANHKAGGFTYGTERVDVARGELAHSLATIADEAGTTIKVVRTTLRRLDSGSTWDGIGPILGTRRGTAKGRGPRILKLLQYERPRAHADSAGTAEGTGRGTESGTAGAQQGHSRGTDRRKEEGKKGKKLPPLPPHWFKNRDLVTPEEGELFLAERKRLCPELDDRTPVTETRLQGVEQPEARKLLDALRAKALERWRRIAA